MHIISSYGAKVVIRPFNSNTITHTHIMPQSLIAAAMISCFESSRHVEALDVYKYFERGGMIASEWLWAGGSDATIHPLC